MEQSINLVYSGLHKPLSKNVNHKIVLYIGYLFPLLFLIDAPLVIFYSLTGLTHPTKVLLYGSEATIIFIFGYLLLYSRNVRVPKFIYIFIIYISLMAFVGLLFSDWYLTIKDARRYIAPLPPLLLGYYFARYFHIKREKYINTIIIFLTIMSVISLLEWFLFFAFYHQILAVYSRFFQTGSYFAYVKHTSSESETGIVTSGLVQMVFRQLGFVKRATGLYLEPYSAGLNSAMAIILILYKKIAGYKILKISNFIIIINLIAVILATSRSAYIFLYISLFVYLVMQRKFHLGILLCTLPFFYSPFRNVLLHTVETFGGGAHRDAILMLPKYLYNNYLSGQGLMGSGLGTFNEYSDSGAIKEIFVQLGLFGLVAFFILHYTVMANIPYSKENRYFVITISLMIFIFCIYSGRIFGYKSLGLVYFVLGYISTKRFVNKQIILQGIQ